MTAVKMPAKYRDVIEAHDWSITDCTFANDKPGYELRKYSPAGEDFSFAVEADDIVNEVVRYSNTFDPDEHIEMWIEARHNGVAGISSTRELVEDADAIEVMLEELAIALKQC